MNSKIGAIKKTGEGKTKKGVGEIAKIAPLLRTADLGEGAFLYTVKTGVRGMATIVGSIHGGMQHSFGNPMIAKVYGEMLLEGTKKKSKKKFHELLEARGIELSFSVDKAYLRFSLRAVKDEIPLALSLLSEALCEPLLDENAFQKIKKRLMGEIREIESDTHELALIQFSQALFPKGHVNYMQNTGDLQKMLSRVSLGDMKKMGEGFGRDGLRVVAVGDVDASEIQKQLTSALGGLNESRFLPYREARNFLPSKRSENNIFVSAKTSIDLFMGTALSMRRDDEEFYPLMLAMSVLGSGFTGRLMGRVRARDGLTYHTYATLAGMQNGASGFWMAYGSFAPQLFARGRLAILREVEEISRHGISERELDHRKTMLAGKHLVSLGTTEGLARAVLSVLEESLPLSLIDEYPQKFKALTLDNVNSVIKKYINTDNLTIVSAGTHPKLGKRELAQ
ncbi:MAG: hypothetical protein COV07_01465 [Candidatus Vogelbacteria bacterium CG10_big_fil_rev_8_21_14_0_10_45_14]|uniref:Peptidase M16 C-terminal domain-containing protein n=1 Tax=Candidatus Vogelbacteria bacterium CG10_big_fil_rev_8_21_14_0_10_45_14 TaxID=1975042 RepID=A0A2H0RMI0_9BACT|nr:MAG: hypothetical protein COV07_01465 [Candidatus Vogelbacteria bacterium CG10_big_fil_rev_8_21_14_0_10_45_14]